MLVLQQSIAIAIMAAALTLLPVAALVSAQVETTSAISGGFADINTVQNDDTIVITITKAGADGAPAPDEPVVIPSNESDTGDGVIVVPLPSNDTADGTESEGNATDVIIIEPDGNVTTVPEGNVTNIDNSTVVVADPENPVTETPGDVVVVGPPECGCPEAPSVPPVVEEPLPPTADENVTSIEPTTNATNNTGLAPLIPSLDNETVANGTSNDDNGNGSDASASAFLMAGQSWLLGLQPQQQ
jgi:hypothetical protein